MNGSIPRDSVMINLLAARDCASKVPVAAAAETAISVKGVITTSEFELSGSIIDRISVPTFGLVPF